MRATHKGGEYIKPFYIDCYKCQAKRVILIIEYENNAKITSCSKCGFIMDYEDIEHNREVKPNR